MMTLYSKIINSPVVELRTQTKVGIVDDLVIHKTKIEVYGIILKKDSFLNFRDTQVVMNTDILEMSSESVIVNDTESILPLSETIRLKEAIAQKYYGIYQRIVTKKGKNIGLVYDYLIDSTTQKITKFYCRTLATEKIISADSVIKMEGKKIYIKDEYESKGIAEPVIETMPV